MAFPTSYEFQTLPNWDPKYLSQEEVTEILKESDKSMGISPEDDWETRRQKETTWEKEHPGEPYGLDLALKVDSFLMAMDQESQKSGWRYPRPDERPPLEKMFLSLLINKARTA